MADPADHADAGLYLHLLAFGIVRKCKLAFISMLVCVYAQIAHKKFCKLSFTRKNFASLRLRKNLVELRARLSLLVDKTTFQHRALTIYYTTIDGHAPSFRPPAPAVVAEWAATDAPGSPPPAPQPWRKWPPWTRRTIPQHPQPRGKGTPWTRPDQPHPHARHGRKKEGTTDAPGSHFHQHPQPWWKGCPGRAGITQQRQHGTGTPSGVFKSYIFPSGFFYKNTNRRAGTPPWAASGI